MISIWGNYSWEETIWGNTVYRFWISRLALGSPKIAGRTNLSKRTLFKLQLFPLFQVTLQEGCNKILVADCFTLLQRQFHNASRGLEVHEASLCGGCGGQCISHSADLSDSFVFNCKHAFHSECFASKLDDTTDDYKSTTCPLCHAK